jgi:hypothetical protein
MKTVRHCQECGYRRPVHIGIGTRYWCKDCAHLAPETPKPKEGRVTDGRVRIRYKLGEEENESKEPETRRI